MVLIQSQLQLPDGCGMASCSPRVEQLHQHAQPWQTARSRVSGAMRQGLNRWSGCMVRVRDSGCDAAAGPLQMGWLTQHLAGSAAGQRCGCSGVYPMWTAVGSVVVAERKRTVAAMHVESDDCAPNSAFTIWRQHVDSHL